MVISNFLWVASFFKVSIGFGSFLEGFFPSFLSLAKKFHTAWRFPKPLDTQLLTMKTCSSIFLGKREEELEEDEEELEELEEFKDEKELE